MIIIKPTVETTTRHSMAFPVYLAAPQSWEPQPRPPRTEFSSILPSFSAKTVSWQLSDWPRFCVLLLHRPFFPPACACFPGTMVKLPRSSRLLLPRPLLYSRFAIRARSLTHGPVSLRAGGVFYPASNVSPRPPKPGILPPQLLCQPTRHQAFGRSTEPGRGCQMPAAERCHGRRMALGSSRYSIAQPSPALLLRMRFNRVTGGRRGGKRID